MTTKQKVIDAPKSERLIPDTPQVTLFFPDEQTRDDFVSWLSNQGEQYHMQDSEIRAEMGKGKEIAHYDYSRAFPAWGYKPEEHGEPLVALETLDELS